MRYDREMCGMIVAFTVYLISIRWLRLCGIIMHELHEERAIKIKTTGKAGEKLLTFACQMHNKRLRKPTEFACKSATILQATNPHDDSKASLAN